MSKFKCSVCEEQGDASACTITTEEEENLPPSRCPWENDNKADWIEE
jgi:hypothetical protein